MTLMSEWMRNSNFVIMTLLIAREENSKLIQPTGLTTHTKKSSACFWLFLVAPCGFSDEGTKAIWQKGKFITFIWSLSRVAFIVAVKQWESRNVPYNISIILISFLSLFSFFTLNSTRPPDAVSVKEIRNCYYFSQRALYDFFLLSFIEGDQHEAFRVESIRL